MLALFALSIVLKVDEANKREYFFMTRKMHSFVFLNHPSSQESQELYPEWEKLQNAVRDNDNFIAADIDCDQHAKLCQSFARYQGGTIIFHGFATRHFPIDPEEMKGDLVALASTYMTKQNKWQCKKIEGKPEQYPVFVFYARNPSVCTTLSSVNWYLPRLAESIFWNESNTDVLLKAHLSENMVVEFSGTHGIPGFVDFIGDYSHATLGDWDIANLPKLTRRFGFVVYANTEELDALKPLLNVYQDRILFGKMSVYEFRQRYPKILLGDGELPAIAVSNKNQMFTVFTGAGQNNFEEISRKLEMTAQGKFDYSMEYSLGPLNVKSMIGSKALPENQLFLGVLALVTIVALNVTLWSKISQCVSRTHKRPVALNCL